MHSSTCLAASRPSISPRCLAPPQISGHVAPRAQPVVHPRAMSRVMGRPDMALRAAAAEAVDAPSDQRIRIKLRAYLKELLTEAVEQIQEAARSSGALVSGPVYLPTRYGAKLFLKK